MVLQSPLTAAALVVALGMLLHLGSQRGKSALHWNLIAVLGGLVIWTFGALVRQGATTPEGVKLGQLVVWLGFQTTVPLWLLVAMRYARVPWVEQRPWGSLALLLPSALAYACVLTNDQHHLYYTKPMSIGSMGGGPREWAGPVFWAFLGWAYTCVLGAIGLYLRASRQMVANRERWRGVLLATLAVFPLVAGTVSLLRIVNFRFDPTAATLAFSLCGLVPAVFRFQLLDTLPLARRDVIEHLRDGVLVADAHGVLLDANPAAERILAVSADVVRGQPLALVLAQLERYAAASALDPGLARLAGGDGPTLMHLQTHDDRRIEVHAASVGGRGGEPAGSFVLLRDRTDEHRTESALRQSQKLETVGSLVAGLAHEVNNPLAFVRANLSHLQRLAELVKGRLDRFEGEEATDLGEIADLVEESLGGIDRIARVVDGMRRFSRLPGDGFAPVDLNAVARESVKLAALHANRNVAVVLRLDPALPPVQGSAERLGQVLLNLLVNAKHALADRPSGRIVVETRRDADTVEIRITDNGPGIPPAIRHRIFDPFFTTKGPDEGTGLGLSIAFDIAREHGGTLDLLSRPQEGACFVLRIAAAGSRSAPAVEARAPDPEGH